MRTVLAVTIALAVFAPAAGMAAQSDATNNLSQMVSAYQQVQVVRVVESFDNGATATVDVMPSGQYRIASTGGQDPALVVKLATKPVPDVTAPGASYTTKAVGTKSMDGVKVNGYSVASADGSYTATVWLNDRHLPMYADVQTQGHKISLAFGDYNNSALIGAR